MLYTHLRTLGTYHNPTIDPKRADYLLAELTWQPRFAPGLSVTGSYGFNGGTLIGRSHGGMLTLAYQGLIKKKK